MTTADLFQGYEILVDQADRAFHDMREKHGTCIKCERHCSDCCHAVFGLFLIEAAYIKKHFDALGSEEKKAALLKCSRADRALKRLEKMLETHEGDPQMQSYIMARERIPCPLLNDDQDCIVYLHRPITCRVYGIPTRILGKARVCGKSGFKGGESYPVFDLDVVHRSLYGLSAELLTSAGGDDPEEASLLISVSRAITAPLEDIIRESYG